MVSPMELRPLIARVVEPRLSLPALGTICLSRSIRLASRCGARLSTPVTFTPPACRQWRARPLAARSDVLDVDLSWSDSRRRTPSGKMTYRERIVRSERWMELSDLQVFLAVV